MIDALARLKTAVGMLRPARLTEARAVRAVRQSGLFDRAYYLGRYPDVAESGLDPVVHFVRHGASEGRSPSRGFDPEGYAAATLGVPVDGIRRFLHYAEATATTIHLDRSEHERRSPPGLMVIFHLCGSEAARELAPTLSLLGHPPFRLTICASAAQTAELAKLAKDADGPVARFDGPGHQVGAWLRVAKEIELSDYRLICAVDLSSASGPSLMRRGVLDEVEEVLQSNPGVGMLTLRQNGAAAPNEGPAASWIRADALGTVLADRQCTSQVFEAAERNAPGQMVRRLSDALQVSGYASVSYQPAVERAAEGVTKGGQRIRLVAFYLPQFHPVPENDAWWGPGFTEWSSVAGARPLYRGHAQPRLPADLGFYDLRVAEARQAQADLAARYGIQAFCYYYYWFDGRRILERPLDEVLASGEPDFPFCVCWANENWTRRWDGLDGEVLLRQSYGPAWAEAFIDDLIPILRDRRYLRYEDKPVLLVYRVGAIEGIRSVLETWRAECRAAGVGEIHVAGVRFWDNSDIHSLGFDAAVDFPPHGIAVRNARAKLRGLRRDFSGLAYDYEYAAAEYLRRSERDGKELVHRGLMTAWDNTPRRGSRAHLAYGASPEAYRRWLEGILRLDEAEGRSESLVFVNAWNEWGEGATLEPDQHFARGFLEATRDALEARGADPAATRQPAGPATTQRRI